MIKIDPNTGRSRGFGFILFKESESVDKVLDQKEYRLDGWVIDPKRAMTMKKDTVKKIFVGEINPDATEDKIRQYLEDFGEIECMELPIHAKTNKRREEDPVKKILEKRFHNVDRSKRKIKVVQLKEVYQQQQYSSRGSQGSWSQGNRGSGCGKGGNGSGGKRGGRIATTSQFPSIILSQEEIHSVALGWISRSHSQLAPKYSNSSHDTTNSMTKTWH
uniref:RRM domain-containing protein n=1 Tax=Sarcophilus harrisii TaxID=9305 RepID=G3VCZ3_SARHA